MDSSAVPVCLGLLVLVAGVCRCQDVCSHGGIRLVGGSSDLEGRVEVCLGGNWGTVCDDNWDANEAAVACRQLGFSDQDSVAVLGPATTTGGRNFGQGSSNMPIVLDNMQCTGNEDSLFACVEENDCNHDEDAGVICQSIDVETVRLVHEGLVLPNNSILSLDSLGDGNASSSSRPLLCVTPLQPCCDTNRSGNWFLGDDPLEDFNNSTDLYQSWGDDQTVQLNRGSAADFMEGGLYRCEVPDADNVTQTLYVGVYLSADEGNVSISDVIYESSSQTLICTSTGGPVDSVTWSRDDTPLVVDGTTYEHSQIITDTDTATYQNRLRIVDKSATLSGIYTCSVGNSRGSTSVPVEIAVCRNDEVRVMRETATFVVIEICVDDVWLRYPLQPPSETLPIVQSLQLESHEDALLLSWEAPQTEEEITGYSVVCSTTLRSNNGRPVTPLNLSVSVSDISVIIPLLSLGEPASYTCCVTAQYEGQASSGPICETIQSAPAPTPTETSDSILVPVLGVLAAVFLLALAVVSVALLVFVCTGVRRKPGAHMLVDIAELESKEPDLHVQPRVSSVPDSKQVSTPIYASINQDEIEAARQEASSPTSLAPNVSNPMYSSIDNFEARRSFVLRRNERAPAIPRSNSAAAVSSMRISQASVERAPVYTAIVPRNLRKKNQSISSGEQEQEDAEEATDSNRVVQTGAMTEEVTEMYSTLQH